jgi:lathosterol oxidase
MDLLLNPLDEYLFTPHVYPETFLPTDPIRQFISLWLMTTIGGAFLVFIPDTISYYFFFDHNLMKHKRFLPNQVRKQYIKTG